MIRYFLFVSICFLTIREGYSSNLLSAISNTDTTKSTLINLDRLHLGYIKSGLWQFGLNYNKMPQFENSHNYIIGLNYNTDKSLSYRLGFGTKIKFKGKAFIQSKLFFKSNPYFRNADKDYTLTYTKLRLDFDYLSSKESDHKLFASLSMINEKQASFNNNVVTFYKAPFYDFIFGYTHPKANELGRRDQQVMLEYGQYKDPFLQSKNFLKLTYQMVNSIKIDKNRNLQLGFYGAYMILNDQRKTGSYANELVKGSISLSGQSFSDYLYNYDHMSRKGDVNFLDNQISRNGGMMRFSNTRGSRVGLSNDLGLVLSSSLEVVKNKHFTISPYLDYGGYSNFVNGKRFMSYAYSGGIELKLKKYLLLFIPIFQSQDIKIANGFSQKGLFNRIGFSFDLRKKYFNSYHSVVLN